MRHSAFGSLYVEDTVTWVPLDLFCLPQIRVNDPNNQEWPSMFLYIWTG